MNAMGFQGTIFVERARIRGLEHSTNGVTVVSEKGRAFFPGAVAFPGFVDAHAHIFGLGRRLSGLNFYAASSAEECVDLAAAYSSFSGNWLSGMGWNQELWKEKSFPDKTILDAAFPDIPVYFSRADGHAAWVNSAALKIADITALTSDPAGGKILKSKSGEPTGILVDNAMDLVNKHIPPISESDKKRNIITAAEQCVRWGLTEVHDMDVDPSLLPIFTGMAENGELPIRVQSYVSAQNDEWHTAGVLPTGGEMFRVAGIKFYADGALGSRGAALLSPYSDSLNTSGLLLLNEEKLLEKMMFAQQFNWSIATHAIGDAANRLTLNAYERFRNIAGNDNVLRIEHAQIVHPDDIPRFYKNNVYAAVQPIHCISDAVMAEHRLGDRIQYAYPYKSLLASGTVLAGSSDFPIESGDPTIGLDAFINRIPFGTGTPWQAQECISTIEAIESYTRAPHILSEMDYRRGKIDLGYDADLTILEGIPNNLSSQFNCKALGVVCAGNVHSFIG